MCTLTLPNGARFVGGARSLPCSTARILHLRYFFGLRSHREPIGKSAVSVVSTRALCPKTPRSVSTKTSPCFSRVSAARREVLRVQGPTQAPASRALPVKHGNGWALQHAHGASAPNLGGAMENLCYRAAHVSAAEACSSRAQCYMECRACGICSR